MNLLILLAQTPTFTPSVTPTATAIASVTPTPTPTATPFHVVVEQEPCWNSSLGIFIVIAVVLAVVVLLGLARKKSGTGSFMEKLFAHFTDMLAYWVVILAFIGIFAIAWQVIKVGGGQPFDATKALDTAKFVFGAILPLLGTWVGTVLAHYFQKENLAAANQSITDLAKTVGNASKLASLPVKDVMIGPGTIITLPADLQGKQDSEIPLKTISDHLKSANRDRLPLFAGNKGSGVARYVVHLSNIDKYLADKALNASASPAAPASAPTVPGAPAAQVAPASPATPATPAAPTTPAAGQNIAALTLADLLTDAHLAPILKSSFSVVKESATLADAKTAMDSITNAPVPGSCYDIFVTATGSPSEPVLGWITNDIINDNAKI